MATQAQVQAQLDMLLADVADESTARGSLETLISNMNKRIADLQQTAAAAPDEVPQALTDKIAALGTALAQNKTKIIADVVANTPVAPIVNQSA